MENKTEGESGKSTVTAAFDIPKDSSLKADEALARQVKIGICACSPRPEYTCTIHAAIIGVIITAREREREAMRGQFDRLIEANHKLRRRVSRLVAEGDR